MVSFLKNKNKNIVAISAVVMIGIVGLGGSPANAATNDPGPTGDFSWEGFNWTKRSSNGAPAFNGKWNPNNVINPDVNGEVQLKITNPTGLAPESAEFYSTKEGFGYGTYTVTVQKDLADMQDEVVWGCLFTYDSNTTPGYNEIDLCEASAWGGGGSANWDPTQGHGYWFDAAAGPGVGNSTITFPVPKTSTQTHRLVWEENKLTFYTFAGSNTSAPLAKKTVMTGTKVPKPARERVHFNLWVVGGNGGEPETVTPETAILKDFEFIPGAPVYPEIVLSPIAEKAQSLNGWLGNPIGSEVAGLKNNGSSQQYEKGAIYWSPNTGAHFNWYGIGEHWRNNGGVNGLYGYPTTDEYLFGNTTIQDYEGGSILWSESKGIVTVDGAIQATWKSYDGQIGLGLPLSNKVASVNNGFVQQFEYATIYWSPTTGAKVVSGAVRGAYMSASAEKGILGYPVNAEVRGLKNGGVKQQFQGGWISWSSASGAWVTKGKIHTAWTNLKSENGALGYPISNEYTVSSGYAQKFQNGTITYKTSSNSTSVTYVKK